jgi:hypothetical protein
MDRGEFIKAIQKMVAVGAIGPSALRGQGAPGVIAAAREFLAALALEQFAVPTQARFDRVLDKATEDLQRAFPVRARHWGTARKALNLFLRDAFYNLYLHRSYGLGVAEKCFELPLDGITARALREENDARSLPRWHGVKYLDKKTSVLYQAFASELAKKRQIRRVHLDTFLWVEGRLRLADG